MAFEYDVVAGSLIVFASCVASVALTRRLAPILWMFPSIALSGTRLGPAHSLTLAEYCTGLAALVLSLAVWTGWIRWKGAHRQGAIAPGEAERAVTKPPK